jgi:hypothetical protein
MTVEINNMTPNVAVEWLAFLIPSGRVPGSNIGPETGDSDAFRDHIQGNDRIVPQIGPRPLPSKSLSIRYSLIILSFDAI